MSENLAISRAAARIVYVFNNNDNNKLKPFIASLLSGVKLDPPSLEARYR